MKMVGGGGVAKFSEASSIYRHVDNVFNPLSPHDALKHHLNPCKLVNRLNFPTNEGFGMKISMKLACQYMVIFFNCSPISNHLHPLQVENCDSNSRLVVDEGDYGKLRLERNHCR